MSRESRARRRADRRAVFLSPWPSGLHAEQLRAALLDGDEALAAWRAWRAGADLDRLDQAAYRLVPLLYRNLERLGVDDGWMPVLRGIYRRSWAQTQTMLRRLSRVLSTLEGGGVATLVLKGAALASQAYGDAGVRPMADLDVWVPPGDLPRALALLEATGWKANPEWMRELAQRPRRFRSSCSAVCLREPTDRLPVLDLHQDVFRIYHRHRLPVPVGRMWRDAERFEVLGVATRRLSPRHQLLHVCVHGVQSNPVAPIRWVADADRLVRARGADIDWDALADEAREFQWVAPVREALEHLAATYRTPVPPSALEALRGAPVSLVERLERPLRRGERGMRADLIGAAAPVLRHARHPGTGYLRALGPEYAARFLVTIPWRYLVREPMRRLRGQR